MIPQRDVARTLVIMRDLLAEVAVARASGQDVRAEGALADMDRQARLLPLALQRDAALVVRVARPMERRLNREGILATAERIGYVA